MTQSIPAPDVPVVLVGLNETGQLVCTAEALSLLFDQPIDYTRGFDDTWTDEQLHVARQRFHEANAAAGGQCDFLDALDY